MFNMYVHLLCLIFQKLVNYFILFCIQSSSPVYIRLYLKVKTLKPKVMVHDYLKMEIQMY